LNDKFPCGFPISDTDLKKIDSFIDHRGLNFNEQTKFLGFNPKRDFRFADLTNVDFSQSDLRGHDFTGADLRGAIALGGAEWDETTVLTDADVESSIFAHLVKTRRNTSNPDLLHELRRLNDNYAD
jgi:uncharacterized protein YjbI with pentapeptide repeats